jgi:beta-lactam-binding protein with PASTA domain
VSFTSQALTALKRIFIVVGIAIAFTLGLLGAIYLSLRSSETRVPDIVGKDRTAAENTISSAGLNFRVRATRPTSDAKPDTVLIQLPHAGEIVKVGQTVAVDISRLTKEGEPSTSANANENSNAEKKPENNNAANSNTNSNDNKQKKKPVNKNANDNLNANANANRPVNRNRNTNGNANSATNGNVNANPAGTPAHSNVNSNAPKGNSNRGTGNSNTNRRPPVTVPTP